MGRCDDCPRSRAEAEVEDLRAALQWALTWIYQVSDEPENGEQREDYAGATRLAWPDEPENWASESVVALDDSHAPEASS